MSVVIYHEKDGIYLGSAMGFGFWSKIDPVGQPSAVTFPDQATAEAYMGTWDGEHPQDVQFIEVATDRDGYASVEACVQAGLPGWIDELMPVANALPV